MASLVASGFLIYYSVMLSLKEAKAFGHEVGFGVGLIFLNFIFTLILAFDSNKYVGPQKDAPKVTDNNQQQ